MLYTLSRVSKTTDRTFGVLLNDVGVPIAVTLELPDLSNTPQVSCIPAGKYTASKYRSPHLGYTVWKFDNVQGRTDVEIHIGNTPADIRGCIIVGIQFGMIGNGVGVLNSKTAFVDFMAVTAEETQLEIEVIDP